VGLLLFLLLLLVAPWLLMLALAAALLFAIAARAWLLVSMFVALFLGIYKAGAETKRPAGQIAHRLR
jgi:hypothetical protein